MESATAKSQFNQVKSTPAKPSTATPVRPSEHHDDDHDDHDENSSSTSLVKTASKPASDIGSEAQQFLTSQTSFDTASHSRPRSPCASPARTARSLRPNTTQIARTTSRSPAPPRTWSEKRQRFVAQNKGVGLMIVAQFFGAAMAAVARLLETDEENGAAMHPFQILFARMSVTMVCCLLYMWIARVPHAPWGRSDIIPLLLVRGLSGFFGVFGLYYSLVYLALGEAIVITFLAPMAAAWICSILIKTPFTRTQQLAGLISILGVILITQPFTFFNSPAPKSPAQASPNGTMSVPTGNSESAGLAAPENRATPGQRAMGVAWGLVGVCGAAGAYTTISWIGKRAHPLLTVNYFATWSTVVSTAALLFVPGVPFRVPATGKEWLLMLFLGTTGFTMQVLLTAAMAHEKSNRVLNMLYSQMFFGVALDKLVWGVTPDLLSLLGSSLILGSVMWVALKKEAEKKETAPAERADEEMGLMEQRAVEDSGHEVEQALERDQREIQFRAIRVRSTTQGRTEVLDDV